MALPGAPPRLQRLPQVLLLVAAMMLTLARAHKTIALPSYHYGEPIRVECMNRSSCVLFRSIH